MPNYDTSWIEVRLRLAINTLDPTASIAAVMTRTMLEPVFGVVATLGLVDLFG